MAARQCYHCKQWIEEGEPHDCWTTTEAALTGDLSKDLRDAWERLRETAVEFGDQRIYASHSWIMFSRKACYFFVRPKKKFLEVCVFLGRVVKSPQVRRVVRPSKSKVAHLIQIRHRDEVEAPFSDWLREAYEQSDVLAEKARKGRKKTGRSKKASAKKDKEEVDYGWRLLPISGVPPPSRPPCRRRSSGRERSCRAAAGLPPRQYQIDQRGDKADSAPCSTKRESATRPTHTAKTKGIRQRR